jgi:hypothetical protein
VIGISLIAASSGFEGAFLFFTTSIFHLKKIVKGYPKSYSFFCYKKENQHTQLCST